jgi:flavin-dependent dehydrogenase
MTMQARAIDVAVVGGGPAGAVTAMLLARAGHTVALLERSLGHRPSMGETLPPVANALLGNIGLADRFSKQPHLPAEGIVSVWSGCVPRVNDFFLSAQGPGWNLNRGLFDLMLLDEAERAGVQIWRDASLVSCQDLGSRGWKLRIRGATKSTWALARYLVDASGRTGASAISFLSRRVLADRLIGAARHYFCENGSRYVLIEAVDDGWFYSAGLPDGRLVVVYFTDADIYSHQRRATRNYWESQLHKTVQTKERLGRGAQLGGDRIVSAATSRRLRFTGPNWLAVGDAAMSFDPLSSLGIYKALDSAIRACDYVAEALRQNGSSASYADWSSHVFLQYMIQREKTYGEQKRWTEYQFWKRRRRSEFLRIS